MNNPEKLSILERVDQCDEAQAKRALKHMILKCSTKTSTIASAIKDALERHAPTPIISYQEPASQDEDETATVKPEKKSHKKKKNDHGNHIDGEEDVSTSTSRKHRKTSRGDINADPVVSELILGKTKTKRDKREKHRKGRDDRDAHQKKPKSSKSKKAKKESGRQAEADEHISEDSVENPSGQNDPIVVDLLNSSEPEKRDSEHSVDEDLTEESSNNDISLDDGSDGASGSNRDGNEVVDAGRPAGDALDKDVTRFKDTGNGETTAAIATNRDDGHVTAQLSTNTRNRPSKQKDGIWFSSLGSTRKRKAPEGHADDANINQTAKTAADTQVHKRATQEDPQVPQNSPEDRTCRKCGVGFPSIGQLFRHRLYCRGLVATFADNLHSELPPIGPSNEAKKSQKADNAAGSIVTNAPHNTIQLPSRPIPRAPAARELSMPPPSFVRGPNRFPRGPTPLPMVLARQAPGVKTLPPKLEHGPVAGANPDRSSELKSLNQDLTQPKKTTNPPPGAIHQGNVEFEFQCKFCAKWFKTRDNLPGACRSHPGT
ncbi:hypothetical protein N8I77_006725 [Diaporthe amygdali]|uniref:C2H2-type domain-containing protein n=1 Tax=Phomopsis amygdali TaxID=1214568 RepID=A0AAD9W493_PHOAM|nr:hypothetical protein N8I77_006725 [Diaporthe amygdali]